ncbi:sensor histidine kinase [Amycolatopsis suaedae]|uniref:sensor histidine kinase n=1 Tax=Amycolatopsis suaedae TaxID=2510978 RepID=UPI0013EF2C8C|nr:histidine kinase [Amycolatopsis suaedae]
MRNVIQQFRPRERDAVESLRRYGLFGTVSAVGTAAVALPIAVLAEEGQPLRAALLIVGCLVVSVLHLRWILVAFRDGGLPGPVWSSVACGVIAVVTLLIAPGFAVSSVVCALLAGMAGTELLFSRLRWASWWVILAWSAFVGFLVWLRPPDRADTDAEVLTVAAAAAAVAVFVTFAEFLTLRQWVLAMELETARREADELATTRERLRLAEDLHDILGHALEVVSLKSELASRLSETDPERSRAELTEVQRLARGALHDVRALVQGRQSTELPAELTAARSLLGSAGIECEFDADTSMLDPAASELFGRVLREAVTNLLRHSAATRCEVTLRFAPETVRLTVVNDGAAPMRDSDGTGLRGLARRVTDAGGTFDAGGTGGRFTVDAELPRRLR